MPYDEQLANRVREALAHLPDVTEKQMFRGLTFMVNGKMCIGVKEEEMMCRIHPDAVEDALEKNGTRVMIHNGKTMKGYVFVDKATLKNQTEFKYWVQLALDFNPLAKASKK
jgi:TfoX/Sxy family transcriptional regulator of competence genes